ncbi:MAG: MucB/RseB C-terminal domain-containing protein [Gammaproteobacteria bacterium]|nr:MucB/RseB C-terminal domain-containing protein [Gammaproteobacteria bacterium]
MNRPRARILARLFVTMAAAAASLVVEAQEVSPQAQELINRMSRAARDLNYDGVFIYRRSREMDTMRLIHKADAEGEHERLVTLTGMPREVIRDDQSVTCIFPDDQAVMVEKSRPRKFVAQLPEPVERIAAYYSFNVEGQDRIAGRDAWVVNITPRDLYRYGYQLWIDKEHSLLLKSELKNKSGAPVEQIMFTQLEVRESIPDDLLRPTMTGQGYTWYHQASAEERADSGAGGWQVTWMPNGFALSNHEKQSLVASGDPVDHLVFTDGLASVSVFIEKLHDVPQIGPAQMGGVNAFARFADGFQVTAVGEVPQSTVQRMANSVVSGR